MHVFTDEERRYLIRHRGAGSVELAIAFDCEEAEVIALASELLKEPLRRFPDEMQRMLCPRCARHYVYPSGTASDRMGICPTCYVELRTEALGDRADYKRAVKQYDTLKHRLARGKRG